MIVIDQEFQSLIPPLSDDEYEGLEKSILTEGFHEWEPIVTWNGTIIDGHNRYAICDEHGIAFKTVERDFPSRDAAKIWILGHQMNRRNLSSGQMAALVIDKREAEVREQARLRQIQHGNTAPGRQKNTWDPKTPSVSESDANEPHEPNGRTAEILAKEAGVGSATIKRAMRVKHESPELYEKVRKGDIPVTTAYGIVVSDKPAEKKSAKKPTKTEDGRRICSICGEPINEGEHYQDKPYWHYQCGLDRMLEIQRRYRDVDHDLRNNVATYTLDSLKAELLASAESMKEALKESIAINESMGVELTSKQKKDLSASVAHVIRTIKKM